MLADRRSSLFDERSSASKPKRKRASTGMSPVTQSISCCAFRWFDFPLRQGFGGQVNVVGANEKILSVSQEIGLRSFRRSASFRLNPQNALNSPFFTTLLAPTLSDEHREVDYCIPLSQVTQCLKASDHLSENGIVTIHVRSVTQ